QAIDRCSNIWASLPGAGYGQFEHKVDSLIAKFKEAGGTVREIEV
ncbi:lysozyme, partial [Escherichia coli]